jgi:hypothetical protein
MNVYLLCIDCEVWSYAGLKLKVINKSHYYVRDTKN